MGQGNDTARWGRRWLLLAALLVPACGGEAGANGKGDGKGKPAEPLAVAVTAIAPAEIDRYYRTSGTLRALRSAELVALQTSYQYNYDSSPAPGVTSRSDRAITTGLIVELR